MTMTPVATKIWTGAPLREVLLAQVRAEIGKLGMAPRLAIVQVGDNAASHAYVRNKLAACAKVGIVGEHVKLREEEGEGMLHTVLAGLAHDPEVNAVIVQTPLPEGWRVQHALDAVPAAKDIDGLCTENMALRRAGDKDALWPATPLGVMRILASLGVEVRGKTVAVIGKGMVVGAPLREILTAAGAEVVGIDKGTPHPARLAHAAEVLVSAAGAPGLVTRAWVRPGAVVVDVGLTRVPQPNHEKPLLAGDVERMSVEGVASVLTSVPGGMGPLTVASLLTNVVDAVHLQKKLAKVAWRLDA